MEEEKFRNSYLSPFTLVACLVVRTYVQASQFPESPLHSFFSKSWQARLEVDDDGIGSTYREKIETYFSTLFSQRKKVRAELSRVGWSKLEAIKARLTHGKEETQLIFFLLA